MQEKVPKSSSRMVRKQMLLTREQNERLRLLSGATGRRESELLREALEQWLEKQAQEEQDWKAIWLAAAGIWKDRTDLDRLFTERRRRRTARRRKMMPARTRG
jgi:hypothetical protein